MQRFPVEIWLHIFRFACVDGGETGCSLALVSKLFNEMSKESRFQCVAAYEDRLPQLAAILEKMEPENRRVKHLFLGTRREKTIRDTKTGERVSSPSYYSIEGYTAIYDGYTRIMKAVHTSLESVYIYHAINAARRYLLLPSPAPRLTALTMYGRSPLFYDTPEEEFPPPVFPSLRCLDMSGFTDYPTDLFERITFQAPNLVNLSLKPSRTPHNLRGDVESALQQSDKEERRRSRGSGAALLNSSDTAVKLPSSIERVSIEVAEDPNPGSAWTGQALFSQNSFRYSADGRLRISPSSSRTPSQPDPEAARQRWVDAQEAKASLPMLGFYDAPSFQAEILTSTTKTVTYD